MDLWDRIVLKAKDIDAWRKFHMAIAELIDAWRIIPRILVGCYAYLTWDIVQWYQSLKPYVLANCNVEILKEACIVNQPTTDHMALVTAVIAMAGVVFGLYTGTGKKWGEFIYWNMIDPATGKKYIFPKLKKENKEVKEQIK